MNTERSLSEIEKNQIKDFPDSKSYYALSCEVLEDYEEGFECNLKLKLKHNKTGDIKVIQFINVSYNERLLIDIREAIGFYIINTSYLGWEPSQRYEVGDWDGEPPIFWAESFVIL